VRCSSHPYAFSFGLPSTGSQVWRWGGRHTQQVLSLSLNSMVIAFVPAAICLVLALRPAFFAAPAQVASNRPLMLAENRWIAPALIIGALAAVPAVIWLTAHTSTAMQYGSFLLTALAALWGAYRLAGWRAMTITCVLVLFSAVTPEQGGRAAISLLSVLAGLGVANVVAVTLRTRPLIVFLAVFAVADLVLVSSGFTRATFVHLPVAGAFGELTVTLRPFMRVQAGSVMLGIGDIVYATLVAAVLVGRRAPLRLIVFVSVAYAAGMVVVAACAVRSGAMLPATLPGAFALAAMWGVNRSNAERPRSWPRMTRERPGAATISSV
jgi:hypothetical protein